MIYIFTALYPEARPLIQHFNLRKDTANTCFQVFRNEDYGICLSITGIGGIASVVAVANICTKYGVKERDFLINVGTCAKLNAGSCVGMKANDCMIFLCNKITEQTTGKTFYPDILYRHSFCETGVVTGAKLLKKGTSKEGDSWDGKEEIRVDTGGTEAKYEEIGSETENHMLYDMEAAAIYQAGAYFFAPHQMSFLKMVSDAGDADAVSAHVVEQLVSAHMEEIADYIRRLCNIAETEQQQEVPLSKQAMAWIEKLTADLHCSKVMQDSLRQHIRYLELAGIPYEDILCKMYAEEQLPCKDKREGKVRFDELKRKLL